MSQDIVKYTFDLEGRQVVFDVKTTPDPIPENAVYPDWAKLSYQQCACCPLKESDCNYCPVATRVHNLPAAFTDNDSTERVRVTVETAERTYVSEVDLQVGINSLMGLYMATSGCPVLKKLSAMANLHVPFCSTEETLHRTVGSYLTQQYFVQRSGGEPDWELKGLIKLYEDLGGLNQDFSKRIQVAVLKDAVSNALIMFFATSVVVSKSLEQQLQTHEAFLKNMD